MELLLPDDVGVECSVDPHPGRPLDGRSPLPRPEGHLHRPGLCGEREVRRRMAGTGHRHRRRPGDGHGPCHPQRVLRRHDDGLLRRLCPQVHRPAVPRRARTRRDRRISTGPLRHRHRPRLRSHVRSRHRGRELQTRPVGQGHELTGRAQRHPGPPLRRRRRRQVEPRPRRHRSGPVHRRGDRRNP